MDYILIGPYQFVRDASKDDMRLDYCSTYREVELNESILSFDTMNAEVCTTTVGAQLSVLPDNTPVIIYRDNKVFARFVKRSISRIGPSTYQIVGRSPMGALTNKKHRGGIYTGETVAEVVTDICGNIPVLVKSIFAGIKLYGWLPYADGKSRSARDNLAQVLFAIGAYLGTDLNGVLRVDPLWNGTASIIDDGRPYTGGTANYDPPISAVTVAEHQYVAGAEEKELFSGTAQNGDIITFSEPMHSLSANGFSILESGANYAKISAGTGTLKGKAYIHNTRLVTRTVTKDAPENVESFLNATLVSLVNSSAVANRLADYFKCRETIINDIVSGREKPGHVVSVYHPYDKKMVLACIQSLDTTMSATLKSNMTALVGYLPPQPETSEYYDERVVLTGSGTWTPPDGVTSVRVTCIGGGQGGKCGQPGALPTATLRTVTTTRTQGNKTFNVTQKGFYTRELTPAEGGAPGEGGHPGKVYTAEMTVAAGVAISYSAGIGGVGGAYEPDNTPEGALGTPSTFGSITSDNGASTDSGYFDELSGEILAAKGDLGVKGGNGVGYDADANLVIPEDIVVAGVHYTAGANSTDKKEDSFGNSTTGVFSGTSYGGLGGGPAYKSSGSAGGDAVWPRKISSNSIWVGTGNQGTGATAQPPEKAAVYGTGGTGGNGGGGNGQSNAYAEVAVLSGTTPSATPVLTVEAGRYTGRGEGSVGGEGADGCIILYYRRPKLVQGGWVKDKNGKLLLDRLDRRFIV